jgi:hypothetical protein
LPGITVTQEAHRPTPALPVEREERTKRLSPILPIGRVEDFWGEGGLPQAAFVLLSLPTGRAGVGLLKFLKFWLHSYIFFHKSLAV